MVQPIETCPIWGEGFSATGYYKPQNRTYYVEDSPRAAGGYILSEVTKHAQVDDLSPEQKARLTSWLVNQRELQNHQPIIREQIVQNAKSNPGTSVGDRAMRLLRFMSGASTRIGNRVDVSDDTHEPFAYSESTTWDEVEFLVRYLEEMRWVDCQHTSGSRSICTVTVAGHSYIAQQATNVDSSQAFVAMWFDDSMTEASEDGIDPAIREAGYEPLRIDRKEHINRIDDEIIAELRRSRFLVADFTHGEDGARGGVYYEAGFAHGLNLPVIFTCREDMVETLHFDTEHYNHIVWKTPADLRVKLKNRILAVIVEGPEAHTPHDHHHRS